MILALAAAAAATVAMGGVPAAGKTQETIFEDEPLMLFSPAGTRNALLTELRRLGVDTIRVNVLWRTLAPLPDSRRRPAGDASRPGFYRGWETYDQLVIAARARGLDVLMTPAAAATVDRGSRIGLPRWAQRPDGSPSAVQFEHFARAVGRRFDGRSRTREGASIPRVSRWAIWNEPNQGGWISPQWKRIGGRWIPWSPHLYRELYLDGRRALLESGHRGDAIYLGETAPLGSDRPSSPATSITPGLFYRELACVDGSLRPLRGRAARVRPGCRRAKQIPASGVDHHFYTKGRGQPASFAGSDPDWMPTAGIGRLERLLDGLAAKGRLPAGLPIRNSEFGFQSSPEDTFSGISHDAQAREENMAEYLSWRRPRIRSFAHYLMVDDACSGARCLGFQTGLKTRDGRPKTAYRAFALPLVVRRTDRADSVRIWGCARAGGAGTAIEIRANGRTVKRVRAGRDGYFDVLVRLPQRRTTLLHWSLADPARHLVSRTATA